MTQQEIGRDAIVALFAAGKTAVSEADVYEILAGNRYRRGLSVSALRDYARTHRGQYRLFVKAGLWYLVPVSPAAVVVRDPIPSGGNPT